MVSWSCSRCHSTTTAATITAATSTSCQQPDHDHTTHNYNFQPFQYGLCQCKSVVQNVRQSCWCHYRRIARKCSSVNLSKLKTHFILLVVTLNIFTNSLASQQSQPPLSHHVNTHTVNTKYGPLRGLKVQFSSSSTRHLDPVSAYLGIPYASPPTNGYRFMPPHAPLPWGPGTRLAITLPPACPQKFPDISNRTRALHSMTIQRYLLLQKLIPFVANQSEDCLYLNFYVPTVPPGEQIRPGRFAIIFVIHGESWEWGSGNEFDGGILASLGNCVVVTLNYRLGVLGFLKTSNQKGNFGLLDVIAALHWVRENGEAFGGDRNRITILGYKTGAVIANLLLVAQIAKDLFHRAILISGSVLSPWALQWHPEEIAFQASIHFGCIGRLPLSHPESDLAPCLRRQHLGELLEFVPSTPRFLSPFAPYIDNILLTNPRLIMERPSFTGASGSGNSKGAGAGPSPMGRQSAVNDQFHNTQLVIIFTTSEGVHELNDYELRHGFESEHRDRILRTLVRNVFNYHQQEIFSIVRNEYTDWDRPILHPIPLRDATVEALSDCLQIAPAIQLALSHAARSSTKPSTNGHSKSTYVLHFSHVSREVDFTPYERLGSLEGDIVPYVMGLPVTNNVPPFGGQPFPSPWSSVANFSKQDAVVAETLVHYLSNFARNGDPNVNDEILAHTDQQQKHFDADDDWVGNNGNGGSREKVRNRALHWDPFEFSSQVYMNMGIKPKLRSHYRGHKLALWLNLIPQIHLSGGNEVALNHHTFPDDNPALYIGTIRHHYPLSFRDQIPGVGSNLFQKHQSYNGADGRLLNTGGVTMSPGLQSPTSTECLDSTADPHGSPNQIEIEEDSVRMNVDSSSSHSHGGGGGFEVVNGEYDYTTALTVTVTVGVCLILLNLVVFSAIMCHRKRGLMSVETISMSTSGSPGSRGVGGTPLKSPFKNDFKWTSCSPVPGRRSPSEDCGTSYPGESIAMSQYHHQHPDAIDMGYTQLDYSGKIPLPQMNCCNSANSTLMRSNNYGQYSEDDESERPPSPFMVMAAAAAAAMMQQHQQPQLHDSRSANNPCHSKQQHHQRVQVQIPMPMDIPNCVSNSATLPRHHQLQMQESCLSSPCCNAAAAASDCGSMRLYMNQSAGEMMAVCNTNSLPRSLYSNTNSLSRLRTQANPIQSPSSSGGATTTSLSTTPNTGGNPSPSTGNTTLVGVLKRHNASGSSNSSTVKKRVQIQEISV